MGSIPTCRKFTYRGDITLQVSNCILNDNATSINIYDSTGRIVRNFSLLGIYDIQSAVVSWNGIDEQGYQVPSGIYFVQLVTEKETLTRKALLLK